MLPAPLRSLSFLLALGAWAAVVLTGWFLGRAGDALLTPLPEGWVGPPMALSFVVAITIAYGVATAVPWRLPRRLVVLAVLASTVYSMGQAVRGSFTTLAFGEVVEHETVTMMLTGGGEGHGQGMVLGATELTRRLPATAELASDVPWGACVDVPVDVAADGAARLPTDLAPVARTDLHPCS